MNFPTTNELFEKYFAKVYQQRWPKILQALTEPEKQVLRKNLFAPAANISSKFVRCDFLANCFWRPTEYALAKNEKDLYNYYAMDPASVIVALSIDCKSDHQVLDMCAAPGGKSLILAEQMSFSDKDVTGNLISNEISESRRERLLRVFHEYIPKEQRMFINVKGLDANQYGLRQPGFYDRVLADVPCSGERHLLENLKELSLWTQKRTEHLAVRQYSLLAAAWLSAKVGGRIVYSTCSISLEENDKVVAKLIKKRKPEILRLGWLTDLDFVEETEYGYQILPDKCGFGPMYFSVIEKT